LTASGDFKIPVYNGYELTASDIKNMPGFFKWLKIFKIWGTKIKFNYE